jgi:transposase
MADVRDEQWTLIEPLLSRESSAKGGRPRAGDRSVLNGVLWVLINGEQWSHLPKKYGSYVTSWRRFREWEGDGTWARVWGALLSSMTRAEQVEWMLAFLDGSFVPGKKGAGGARLG